MSSATVNFDTPNLAARIEQLSQHELDQLPFGVILIDREGTVLFYSETEARRSGYGKVPLGENLFELSHCLASDNFRGRIMRAIEQGPLDLEIGWAGDFADPKRDLRFRIQTSGPKDIWIFVDRDCAHGIPDGRSQ
jgi:photoactive yellow protein